jgi:hypothetical protein
MNGDGTNGDSAANGRRSGNRAVSRHAQKAQFDARNRMAEAMDRAKAAELALTELLGSLRAAK